jgi:hypothetical protein
MAAGVSKRIDSHKDFSSMLMAAFFAIAVVSYTIGLYLARTSQSS